MWLDLYGCHTCCLKKGHFNAENAFQALGYVTLLLKFRQVYYYNFYSQKKSDILKGQKSSVDSAKSETHALYAQPALIVKVIVMKQHMSKNSIVLPLCKKANCHSK